MNRTSPGCRSVRQSRKVSGADERRPRGDPEPDSHLGGDDPAESDVFPRPGRSDEQQVVDRLAAPAGRLDDDLQVLGQLRLTYEVLEAPWSKTGFFGQLRRVRHRIHRAVRGDPGGHILVVT